MNHDEQLNSSNCRLHYIPPCIEAEDDLGAESLLQFAYGSQGQTEMQCGEC